MSPSASFRHLFRPCRRTGGGTRAAFTLIELLVVVIILTILASLSLAGLAGARQRSKVDKTRSTIRKIDAVIRPMYDSYRTRRVNAATTTDRLANASNVLAAKRLLMVREMPDTWDDVASAITASQPATAKAYTRYRTALTPGANGSHECLYMIIARSGFEPNALENFRTDEVIDYDGDGAKEFSDGWGSPVAFMRWAPGFTSPIQTNDPTNAHDPLDPLGRDATAFALVPLIYSAGPDEIYGLVTMSGTTVSGPTSGWASLPLTSMCTLTVAGASTASWNGRLPGSTDPSNTTGAIDNVTNHDLSRR
jgi:prepilin-type N-terminal cleavage/methylation domain-containing protein